MNSIENMISYQTNPLNQSPIASLFLPPSSSATLGSRPLVTFQQKKTKSKKKKKKLSGRKTNNIQRPTPPTPAGTNQLGGCSPNVNTVTMATEPYNNSAHGSAWLRTNPTGGIDPIEEDHANHLTRISRNGVQNGELMKGRS